MRAFYALFIVFALVLLPLFGVGTMHLGWFFGIVLPWLSILIFVVFFVLRVLGWARSPQPFPITTTGGQQWSPMEDIVQPNCFDNPKDLRGVIGRMFFEIALFRSLFRNTKVELYKDADGEPIVAYASNKWLWLFSLMFHYSFLVIIIRHLRLFLEPIPLFVTFTDQLDSMLQILAPTLYLSDGLILVGVTFLLLRRLLAPQLRYISLVSDYFPLFLILGIALSGVYMRYIAKVDVVAIKQLTMGLVTFHPVIPANIGTAFFVHLFLVCTLLVYFPFSKLMHLGGVFLSPSRNLPNNSRMVHYDNPWNQKIAPHSYAAYEDDFREPMIEAGLPVEKTE